MVKILNLQHIKQELTKAEKQMHIRTQIKKEDMTAIEMQKNKMKLDYMDMIQLKQIKMKTTIQMQKIFGQEENK